MAHAIKIVSRADGKASKLDGTYLMSFSPNAFSGRGDVVTTPDLNKALKFDSFSAAVACWKQTSSKYPLRPDGKPNRPMTAFTVEIIPV